MCYEVDTAVNIGLWVYMWIIIRSLLLRLVMTRWNQFAVRRNKINNGNSKTKEFRREESKLIV